jgi:hypothetical protein
VTGMSFSRSLFSNVPWLSRMTWMSVPACLFN